MSKATSYCNKVFDGTHDSPKPTKHGYKLLTSKNIMNGYLDKTDSYFISEEDYNNINKRSKVQKWDVLFSMIGTVGNVCIIEDDEVDYAIKNMGVFSCGNEYKAKWLYFYLQSPYVKKLCENYLNGAIQKFISLGWLRELEIHDFNNDKIRIVDLLWEIDNKQKNNNKINTELESIAKTLYDYWFLQFEFPNEEGKPYKSSGGKMVYNEELKREIPEGWEVKELLDLVDWLTNSQPPKSVFKYHQEKGYVRFIQNRDYSSSDHITFIPFKPSMNVVDRLDILMDKYGDAGVVRYGINGVFNVALAQIKPKNDSMREYIRSLLLSNSMYTYFHNSCMASTRASLSEENLKKVCVVLPKMSTILNFENKVSAIRKMILENIDQNQELASLRDFLLPMLMNGQVTFKEKDK